jgi:23S rRNA pseudouridine2605 synthase
MVENDKWQDKPGEGEFSARRTNNDRPSGNSFDRPRRSFNEGQGGYNRSGGSNSFDKPKRSYNNEGGNSFDRPRRSFDGESRFDNTSRTDRPKRTFGNEGGGGYDRTRRPYNSEGGFNSDRPRRTFGEGAGGNRFDRSQRPYQADGNKFDKPRRSFGEGVNGNTYERSPRSFGNDEGGRSFDRPKRSFVEEGGRSFDRPKRSFDGGGDRPRRSFDNAGGDRPRRSYDTEGGDRPRRSFDNDGGGYRPRFNGPSLPKPDRSDGRPRRPRIQKPDRPFDSGRSSRGQSAPKYPVFQDPDALIRLNKFLANAGLCSRREADEFIQAGVVKVNGETVTELGVKIKGNDTVLFHDQMVSIEHKVYILLNKPKDCVTTSDDPQERRTVLDLVKGACAERIYPVGRLDRNTTGVLLLTNDGDLASKLTHPKYEKRKIYQVTLDKDINREDIQHILDGVVLEDCEVKADNCSLVDEDRNDVVGIEIHSGQNRVVRRMFESLGYKVYKLDRVYFAGLTKKNLPRGKWRHLTEKEVSLLKMGAFV